MEKENNCSNCKHTNKAEDEFPCSVCVRNYIDKYEPTTNYDRIKNMSVEEMAQTINDKTYGCMFRFGCPCNCGDNYPENCVDKIKKWLLQEVSDD